MAVLFGKYIFLASAPVIRSERSDVGALSAIPEICCTNESYFSAGNADIGITHTTWTATSLEIRCKRFKSIII